MNAQSRQIVDGVKELAMEISRTGDIDDGYRKCTVYVLREALAMAGNADDPFQFLGELIEDMDNDHIGTDDIKEMFKQIMTRLAKLEENL